MARLGAGQTRTDWGEWGRGGGRAGGNAAVLGPRRSLQETWRMRRLRVHQRGGSHKSTQHDAAPKSPVSHPAHHHQCTREPVECYRSHTSSPSICTANSPRRRASSPWGSPRPRPAPLSPLFPRPLVRRRRPRHRPCAGARHLRLRFPGPRAGPPKMEEDAQRNARWDAQTQRGTAGPTRRGKQSG